MSTQSLTKRAKTFWAEEDVDQVFDGIFDYLDYLKRVLKKNAATDKGQTLTSCLFLRGDVVIGAGKRSYSERNCVCVCVCSYFGGVFLSHPLHHTVVVPAVSLQSCLPSLPSMPHSATAFWGQNPLKVPLLCGFRRLSDWDVVYKTPCGLSLRNHDDVMRFLLATESYDVMQMDFFTFNPCVRLDPPQPAGPRRPEMDLSRGVEPTPVQLCLADCGARPAEFRYRKERWPHGCFLSRGPALFAACCDCTDGCSDPQLCACVNATTGGRRYSHHRLTEPVTLFECGPWCGCVRTRCQNRLVQRGITVRLQVFQTGACGWGVRCRDDLDHGTFVCIYAGVMLRRAQSPSTVPALKLARTELPSDDEVEVVTEWLAPPVQEGRGVPEPAGGDANITRHRHPETHGQQRGQHATRQRQGEGRSPEAKASRALKEEEDVYILDASKEGNVSRFINVRHVTHTHTHTHTYSVK
uniref:Histone-lysine N-methyltransferase SETDB2 n=1 Tax=Sander lucioperca TaxID=283035 RepID=A0A8D0DDZ9_SANLU